eukprot:jgi/Tetstr1/443665/TSEL_031657.t1
MIDFACVSSTTPTWSNEPRWCTPGIAATEAEQALLLLLASTTTRAQNSWACPGNQAAEDDLTASCKFFDSDLLTAVKAGTAEAAELVTANAGTLGQACETGCMFAIQNTLCFGTDLRRMVSTVCSCRADMLLNACSLGLQDMLPLVLNPKFSVDAPLFVPTAEEADALIASAPVVCNTCKSYIDGSSQCVPLLDDIALGCCASNVLADVACVSLRQVVSELADPTSNAVLAAYVASRQPELSEVQRASALEAAGVVTVADLMAVPVGEVCGMFDPSEVSENIESCRTKQECLGADDPEDDTGLGEFAGLCTSLEQNSCIATALATCMAAPALELLEISKAEVVAAERRKMEYNGLGSIVSGPAEMMLTVLTGAADRGNDVEPFITPLCSSECEAAVGSCPALAQLPGVDVFFTWFDTLASSGLCVVPTPEPTLPPLIQFYLARVDISLALESSEAFTAALRESLAFDIGAAAGAAEVSILGEEVTPNGLLVHVAAVFEAEEGTGAPLISAFQDALSMTNTTTFSPELPSPSVASFISDPGATQEAVTAKLRELMAEYTPPPPPVLTEAPTPAPTTLATQFRAVQISVTLSLAAVEDFTDALRAQFLADLQRLPGVESAQILATMQGSVIVKAAVIVSGEGAAGADAAVQSVTSALSNTSGVFASEMGATGAAVEETKAASSLAAAEAIVAEYKQGLEVNMEESQASRWVPSVALLLASLAYCMQY